MIITGVVQAQSDEASNLEVLADGNTQFAFDLYHQLTENSDNLIFSPYSVSSALAMLYGGARGQTRDQMALTLHFVQTQEVIHPTFAELNTMLTSIEGGDYEEDFVLNIANAIWGQEGYPFSADYLDLLGSSA